MPWRAGGWVRAAGGGSGWHKGGPDSATVSCLGHGPLYVFQSGQDTGPSTVPSGTCHCGVGGGEWVRSRGEGTTSQDSHHGMEAG